MIGVPQRAPYGISTDAPFGPLRMLGNPHPFNYHMFVDDFDFEVDSGKYTKTVDANGTVALTAGDGGRVLFTTNSSTPLVGDIGSLQSIVAGFSLLAGKRAWFMTRLKLSSAANAAFVVGLIQKTTTPFTVADGIYIGSATGSAANLTLYSVVGSAATSVALPTTAYTMADATDIDLAIFVNRFGDVEAFVGSNLIAQPQSGTGSANSAGVSVLPSVGPVARLTAPSLTAVNLCPTLAVQSGTASSKTMNCDFILAAKER